MNRNYTIFYFIFLVFIASNCFAEESSFKNSDAFRTLLNAETFSAGGTGFAGMPTTETLAFKSIFSARNALEQFKVLFDKATSEGKLYALSGLYFYDYSKFKAAVNGLVDSPKKVTQFSGCMIGENKISELIKIESENVVRLGNNKQTIKSWMDENKITVGFSVDFWGGGYPQLLKEYIQSQCCLINHTHSKSCGDTVG
jgi:hypothetical protein